MIKTCARCGSEFEQPPGKGRNRKYCSPNCDHVPFQCDRCGGTFTGYPGKRFCSKECRVTSLTAGNHDVEVQRSRGRRGGKVRGAQLHALGTHPNRYLKEAGEHVHRMTAELILGRPLNPGEVVHHEDRVKHNNDPHNLIVFLSQADHARHHKLNHENHEPCSCAGIRLKDLV